MRVLPTAALLLPALTASPTLAQQQAQVPFSSQLSSLWDAISPYIPGYANPYTTTSRANSAHTKQITNLTAASWATELSTHAAAPWLVLITGGNSTCGTHNASCAAVDAAWESASAVARTDIRAPNLGFVDCESNRLLCATWGAHPATVWWIEPEVRVVKAADTVAAQVTAREAAVEGAERLDIKTSAVQETSREVWIVGLNKTTVTAGDITSLYKKGEYKTRGHVLDGESLMSRHPFNGQMAKLGLNVPVGYVFFLMGMLPNWTTVMMLSFTARMFL